MQHITLVAVTLCLAVGCSDTAADSTTTDAAGDGVAPTVAAHWGAMAGGDAANVVVIVADDLGYGDVSALCDRSACPLRIPTPNIDRLAAGGMWLLDAYTTAGTCSPARAGFNSGRYQQQQGFEFNTRDFRTAVEEGRGIRADTQLLSKHLESAGYATGIIGKWHMGITSTPTSAPPGQPLSLDMIDMDLHPLNQGFDSYYGFLEGAHDYWPPEQGGDTSFIMRGLVREPHTAYLTDVFADEAVAFIEANAGAPFYLYVPFSAPHKPLQADPAIEARFASEADADRRTYMAMVVSLDNAVGRILDTLDARGISEDTLIFFFSDNGALNDPFASNHPLRLGKATLFDGGVRIPYAVRYPRYLTGGIACDQVVSVLDLVPSALDAAGISVDGLGLAGQNLAELAADGCTGTRAERDLFWRAGPNRAMRRGQHKLVQATNTSSGLSRTWLFDLSSDIGETTDLSTTEPALVTTMEQALDAWEAGLEVPRWPAFQGGEILIDGFAYEYHL